MAISKVVKYFSLLIVLSSSLIAQNLILDNHKSYDNWAAQWISHPESKINEQGVYLFKKILPIQKLPEKFVIHISADNRYKLYVNNELICMGPAIGDFKKWRFETLDIAPYLISGNNTICVKVWNFGSARPTALNSFSTGLIIQGDSQNSKVINTNSKWKVLKDNSYEFKQVESIGGYYVAGPNELFNSINHHWDWQSQNFDSKLWVNSIEVALGESLKDISNYGHLPERALYPRDIEGLEYTKQEFYKIRRVEGLNLSDAEKLIKQKSNLIIPKNSKVSILVDNRVLTNAYPQLTYSKGKNSKIKLTYAESLHYREIIKEGEEDISILKGDRDEIGGKEIKGVYDLIICDGSKQPRDFESLWWRCFRYIQVVIETGNEELHLKNFHSLFVGYPLIEKASFSSDNPILDSIWDVGWRTQRLCANESFYDCPYYEQMQYTGDTRIQSLITFYVSGDTLLWRKAINDYYDSRTAMGITQSRYPSSTPQFIPTFSLVWITMLSDYLMHCNDKDFIHEKLPAVIDILQWFEKRLDKNKLPGKLEFWNFVDWVDSEGWDSGIPPLSEGKSSGIIALQYLYTLEKASFLFDYYGLNDYLEYYSELSENIKNSVQKIFWNETRGLFADTPEQELYSQHANVLAILTDMVPPEKQDEIIKIVMEDTSLAQCSYYFSFYIAEALKKTRSPELYFQLLKKWEISLNMGLTTFPETNPNTTRSDCHAWSASPLYFMLSLICGIEPINPGFNQLKIAPVFGNLQNIEVSFPHVKGEILINLEKKGKNLKGEIFIPNDLEVQLEWNNKVYYLTKGENSIEI